MLSKIFLFLVSALFVSSLAATSNAGSAASDICIKKNAGVQGIIKMASLSEKRAYRISGKRKSEIAQTPRPVPAGTIKVAARCGSSKYYCTSPGFLYCCGNSSSGFYCAADVNGCTR